MLTQNNGKSTNACRKKRMQSIKKHTRQLKFLMIVEKIPKGSGVQLNLLSAKVRCILRLFLVNGFATFTFLIWIILIYNVT